MRCTADTGHHVTATWPGLGDLPAVFEAWQRSAPYADHRLTSQLEVRPHEIMLVAALAPGTEPEATGMLASILSVGEPVVATRDASWADIYAGFQIPTENEPANWKFLSQFMTEPFPAEAIRVVCDFMSRAPTPECNYFTNAFGGAVAGSEPAGGSVFAHADALFLRRARRRVGPTRRDPGIRRPAAAPCQGLDRRVW